MLGAHLPRCRAFPSGQQRPATGGTKKREASALRMLLFLAEQEGFEPSDGF